MVAALMMAAAFAAWFYCRNRGELIKESFKQQLTPPFFFDPNGGVSFSAIWLLGADISSVGLCRI